MDFDKQRRYLHISYWQQFFFLSSIVLGPVVFLIQKNYGFRPPKELIDVMVTAILYRSNPTLSAFLGAAKLI